MHPRAEIRNTYQSLLIAAPTIAEDRVFKSRAIPVSEEKIPCILVFTSEEEITERTDSESDQARKRDVTLHLQLWFTALSSELEPDAALDAFCGVVESVMDINEYLALPISGKRTSHEFQSTQIRLHDAEKRLMWALLTYTVSYLG